MSLQGKIDSERNCGINYNILLGDNDFKEEEGTKGKEVVHNGGCIKRVNTDRGR